MNWIQDLIKNPLLIGAISAWFVAQISKVIIYTKDNVSVYTRKNLI